MKKLIFALLLALCGSLSAQETDKGKGIYMPYPYEDSETIKFRLDVSGLDYPDKVADYEKAWTNQVVDQGLDPTCWAFSTCSFYESEVKRLHGKEVKLSEAYFVYVENIEQTREYFRTRGESRLTGGSETNAITRLMKMYGAMPLSAYDAPKDTAGKYDQKAMLKEIHTYLRSVKENCAWDEEEMVGQVKLLMDHHMGAPPAKFSYDGKSYTPETFRDEYLQLNPEDYVDVMSLMKLPYWEQVEYPAPDNWWHCDEYYNVPLDVFMEVLTTAVKGGYTAAIGGDVFDAGMEPRWQVAVVPAFDIASEDINQYSRQYRHFLGQTGDGHAMHLVGWAEEDGQLWFLVKDSSGGSKIDNEGTPEHGYFFFHSDYVKLKMLYYTIHKDALKDYMDKFE